MALFERVWANFAVKVLSDCPYLVPFPRYRRQKSDYVIPKNRFTKTSDSPRKHVLGGISPPTMCRNFSLISL